LYIAAVALVPAALAGCRVDCLTEGMGADYAHPRFASAEIPNQGPKEW
jgi:hypothetical protein